MVDLLYFNDVFRGMHQFGPTYVDMNVNENGGVGWVVVITKTKKQGNGNGRVKISNDIHM